LALRIATRGSLLAKTQAGTVAAMLGGADLVEVANESGAADKARFVRTVETALLRGEAEIGVHSAKDLPGEEVEGLEIAAVPVREDPADAWIGAGATLDDVPEGARVGTASLRRRAQLLAARPDLRVEELHGNVDTRLRKLREGELDAIVLAAAGLRRLGREGEIGFALPAATMVPAAGQGALAIQVRAGDAETSAAARAIGDGDALREFSAERIVVALLEASCATPLGVHARVTGDRLAIDAFVGLPNGAEWLRDSFAGDAAEPVAAGRALAERLLSAGAREILDRAELQAADGPKT
jgi:hydroxymethylbilane synthase